MNTILYPRFTPGALGTLAQLGLPITDYEAEMQELAADPDCLPLEFDQSEVLRMLTWMHRTETTLDLAGITAYCIYLAYQLANPVGNA